MCTCIGHAYVWLVISNDEAQADKPQYLYGVHEIMASKLSLAWL